MDVKDLDTPLHGLMQYLEADEYARLTDEFTDFVKEDFNERVQEVQIHTKEKRSFLFIKSFIDKVRRKQYKAAHEHLGAARQQYQKFMLQYESLPHRKKQPAVESNPQTEVNEPQSAVIPNETTNSGNRALPFAKSPPPAYTPHLQKHIKSPVRPESIPRSDIAERQEPPIERITPQLRQDIKHTDRPAIFRKEEASPELTEKERKRQKEPFFPVQSRDEYKPVTPWKHVREFKPNVFSYEYVDVK
ncbi:hypothetical protein CHS0354_026410 [Potamilus streckersoni]|uniref:Uncharacterized protein n=1 Tax=Potamilus streckersoni TaxID=2493646 RepID=A0AAE0W621_9BIVA|nr:hypothetical protein CHS0354_026410 [Potamilus streckersoni]